MVYKKISIAFAVLEENAIYIEQELEREIVVTLDAIRKSYDELHTSLKLAHAKASALHKDDKLHPESAPLDFGEFRDVSAHNWNVTTLTVRHNLKAYIRDSLSF